MNEIIELLKKDARLSAEDIASLLDKKVADVKKTIDSLEKDGIILKYSAVINEEKLPKQKDKVIAFIEISINPEREKGFDAIAERIYEFPQVKSLYLMSGGYDLIAEVEGNNLRDVSFFVSDNLSILDNVRSTSTHFLLKKYKENGVLLTKQGKGTRLDVAF